MALMLYGKHGRIGVELLESVFRDMGLRPGRARRSRSSKTRSRRCRRIIPSTSYLKLARDLQDDAASGGYLSARSCAQLHRRRVHRLRHLGGTGVSKAGFTRRRTTRRDLSGRPAGYFPAVNALPENKIWSVMERLQTLNGCHFFMACHPERPKSSYTIDFSTSAAFDYVPLLRMRCGVSGTKLSGRPGAYVSIRLNCRLSQQCRRPIARFARSSADLAAARNARRGQRGRPGDVTAASYFSRCGVWTSSRWR